MFSCSSPGGNDGFLPDCVGVAATADDRSTAAVFGVGAGAVFEEGRVVVHVVRELVPRHQLRLEDGPPVKRALLHGPVHRVPARSQNTACRRQVKGVEKNFIKNLRQKSSTRWERLKSALYPRFKMRIQFFQIVKGEPFGLFENAVCCKISEKMKEGPFGDIKNSKKVCLTKPKKGTGKVSHCRKKVKGYPSALQ